MKTLIPTVGQWYTNRSGAAFEVVAVDDENNAIDIQFVDGTVDELDDDRWSKSTVEEIDIPNDCIVSLTETTDADSLQDDFVPRDEWIDSFDFMDLEFVELEDQTGYV